MKGRKGWKRESREENIANIAVVLPPVVIYCGFEYFNLQAWLLYKYLLSHRSLSVSGTGRHCSLAECVNSTNCNISP
jgi:hypothetical protein